MKSFKARLALAVLSALPTSYLSAGPLQQRKPVEMTVMREVHHDTSAPLRDIMAQNPAPSPTNPDLEEVPNRFLDLEDITGRPVDGSTVPAQRSALGDPTPAVGLAVNGLRVGLGANGTPPDTTGDVGPDHFFQWINSSWALFDKTTGAIVSGPTSGNSFFAGFGGLCQTTNRGDPLVLWDDHARRWVVSQFAFTGGGNTAPFFQCVAVSATEDPLGSYHRYAFQFPSFNDYGKMGVWVTEDGGQNAYVFSMHEFGAEFEGASFSVVERDRMLEGQSAQFIRFAGLEDAYGAIPFHLEGVNPMPAGTCPIFVHRAGGGRAYRLWDVCVDWAGGTASFDPNATFLQSDPYDVGMPQVPQQTSTRLLDSFGGNIMYLAAMRAFPPTGPSEATGVINHVANVGSDVGGIRWVKFGISAGDPPSNGDNLFESGFEQAVPGVPSNKRIIDQGTYAPDSDTRWMGSINQDQSGNMMVGYSVGSASLNPQIRIAGRLRDDPPGNLRPETQCSTTGTGAQTGSSRWGDYSTMGVDPDDQCTFWFTNEYYTVTSSTGYNTRICSLKFPTCGDVDFSLETLPSERISVCGVDRSVGIRAAEFGTLGGNVTLTEGTVPPGVTLSINPASIAAGETAAVTVNGAAALADGVYSAQVNGMAGALNRSGQIDFGVSASIAGATTATSPADTSTGVATRPTYTWTASAGANSYRVEVALDAAFSQIVDTTEISGTSYESNILLQPGTTHFWRVTSVNFCGDSSASTTLSFTTGVPGQCPGGTTATQLFADDISGNGIAWTTVNALGGAASHWAKTTPPAGTGLTTRAWFAANAPEPADQQLISPPIVLPAAGGNLPITLAFDTFHQYEIEDTEHCFDGGFVEITINAGGTWTPLGDARNQTDAYNGTLSTSNALVGNAAWCVQPPGGNSVNAVFALDDFAGETVQLRFRSTADANAIGDAPAGWGVDNVLVQSCAD